MRFKMGIPYVYGFELRIVTGRDQPIDSAEGTYFEESPFAGKAIEDGTAFTSARAADPTVGGERIVRSRD
jgi:hypothetical protein